MFGVLVLAGSLTASAEAVGKPADQAARVTCAMCHRGATTPAVAAARPVHLRRHAARDPVARPRQVVVRQLHLLPGAGIGLQSTVLGPQSTVNN